MPTVPLTRTPPPSRSRIRLLSSAASPTLLSSAASPTFRKGPSCSLFGLRPKRFPCLNPCSSLKGTKKQQQHILSKAPSSAPQSLRRLLNLNPRGEHEQFKDGDAADSDGGGDVAVKGTILAGLLLVGVFGGYGAVGYIYKEQINVFLTQLSGIIEGYGPAGYALFITVYAGLEMLAIPAIPLTMSAGVLFGSVTGTIIVSISGTLAASVAFVIARYFAREWILKLIDGNEKFVVIDKAIGENGFGVVTLLRLSPLLPFSIGNYLYGLTSVKFVPYILGSWLGMLPGTWTYVSAGAFGRAVIQQQEAGCESGLSVGNGQMLSVGIGVLATALAANYVAQLANKTN